MGTRADTDVVRALVRAALTVETGSAVDLVPASPGVLETVRRHRVSDLLARHGAALALPDDLLDAVRADHDRSVRGALVLAHDLLRALDVLGSAGVRVLVVKGVALAAQTTGDLAARGVGDLDLLVAPADLETAVQALAGLGYQPREGFPRDGRSWGWRWLVSSYFEVALGSARTTIDLHWHLTLTHDHAPAFDELWQRRATVPIGGRDVSTLSVRDALWHSCVHAARDDWRWLRSLVDVHRLARLPGAFDALPDTRAVRATLSVVGAQVGLPGGPPDHDAGPWDKVAHRAQEAEFVIDYDGVPGGRLVSELRRALRDATGPGDVRRSVAYVLLPGNQLGDVAGVREATAVRGRHLVERTREWVSSRG